MHNFKAIETIYNGYRFRSRIEARWATFFDALGVPWEYEKEGYVLEGMTYLPDFWLPEQDCFVEIKGQEPTEEERMKARLLCIYTQKKVNVFYGSIDAPEPSIRDEKSLRYTPPSVWKYPKSEYTPGGPSTMRIDVPPHVLALIQHLHDHHLVLSFQHEGSIFVEPDNSRLYGYAVDDLIEHLEMQLNGIQRFGATFEKLKDELLQIFDVGDEWTTEILYMEEMWYEDGPLWMECDRCGAFDITWLASMHFCNRKKNEKDFDTKGKFVFNTPRLLAAYTAARSARFEHGEKGR